MRGRAWVAGLILLGGIALGLFSWPVTAPLNGWLRRFSGEKSRWALSLAEARWVPLRNRVELKDLRIQAPGGGGRVHLAQVVAAANPFSILGGSLGVHCRFREGRIDPGSWGIRKQPLVEILSSAPVAEEGHAVLRIQWRRIFFRPLVLSGPLFRIQAEGWLGEGAQAHLRIKGALAREFLRGLNLAGPEGAEAPLWEPFQCDLDGALSHPEISFVSGVLTFSFKNSGER